MPSDAAEDRDPGRLATMLARGLYRVLSYLLAPLAFGFLIFRGLRNRAYLERFGERFGLASVRFSTPSIWVHAVSVGEVQAAAPMVRALLREFPQIPVVVTTTTPTGAQRVKDMFGDDVAHVYAPYDLPGGVRRFFDRLQPRLAIVIETELWPNLYSECGRRNIPLVLASARISPRSLGKYRRFMVLFKEALSHGIVIAAQSEADAQRFRALGAAPERTHVTGNIKFDFEFPESLRTAGLAFRAEQTYRRPVWVAASTHAGEEQQVLAAFRDVLKSQPRCLLVLVPRHPERFLAVGAMLRSQGFAFVTRSSGHRCEPDTGVFLVDTLGELPMFYAASDVAFVGGSLVPVGGHNLLEPAAVGKPIITGPWFFNAEEIAELLMEAGGARCVADAAELSRAVLEYLGDPQASAEAGEHARRTVEENRGALARLLALIRPLVSDSGVEGADQLLDVGGGGRSPM